MLAQQVGTAVDIVERMTTALNININRDHFEKL